jgi:hypothetical protein
MDNDHIPLTKLSNKYKEILTQKTLNLIKEK